MLKAGFKPKEAKPSPYLTTSAMSIFITHVLKLTPVLNIP